MREITKEELENWWNSRPKEIKKAIYLKWFNVEPPHDL